MPKNPKRKARRNPPIESYLAEMEAALKRKDYETARAQARLFEGELMAAKKLGWLYSGKIKVPWEAKEYRNAVKFYFGLGGTKAPDMRHLRNPRRARRNPPRANPPFPRGYRQVYYELGRIEGRKDPSGADNHPCNSRCKAACHWYRHGFKRGARLYQSPDGKTLMIRGK